MFNIIPNVVEFKTSKPPDLEGNPRQILQDKIVALAGYLKDIADYCLEEPTESVKLTLNSLITDFQFDIHPLTEKDHS